MKNEEKIYQGLCELSEKALASSSEGVTTSELADHLKMDRTLVSRHLGALVQTGKAVKTGSKPIYYRSSSCMPAGDMEKTDVFAQLIGSHGSLLTAVEQCKSSVLYPNGGLPLLITGSSGVGKSYLANLIFEYAKNEGIIEKDAKCVIFNCADYANNKELLSSKLFGYKKGTFTGADEDNDGVIALANGGYLFLDEVHRLSPEGQEKLFLLLDKGIYQRMGDKNYQSVQVRVIAATTEDPKTALIDTFLRRIPIQVHLPDFASRNISERLELIQLFYAQESQTFHKPIRVSKKVVNYLLSCVLLGNIGALRNIIKVSCANASRKNREALVQVDIEDIARELPQHVEVHEFTSADLEIGSSFARSPITPSSLPNVKEVIDIITDIYEQLKACQRLVLSEEEVEKCIRLDVNRISDVLYFHSNNNPQSLYYSLFATHVENGLKLLEKTYGLKYYGNTVKTLSSVLNAFSKEPLFQSDEYVVLYRKTLELIKHRSYKYNFVTNRLLEYLRDSFHYQYGVLEELYLTLYIYSSVVDHHSDINAIIVAHGYSTASSIASVVNQMHSNYIFESFDMPIDMEPQDIVKEISEYAKHLNKDKDTIFLVDMGSLFEIYSLVKDSFNGEMVVINNITTQLALGVGSMINQGRSLIDIVDSVVRDCSIKYKYFERKGKKRAIVTTCASGIGIANKIRDMIKKCVAGEKQNIEIISCDYFTLKNMGRNSEIFKKYDVQLIISTLGLTIEGVSTILFSDLFSAKNEERVRDVFAKLYGEENLHQIINNLMKMLTLENIISRLIILNPNRVIENVDAILSDIENCFAYQLDSSLKLTLYIHIAIMLERCILSRNELQELPYSGKESMEDINKMRRIFEKQLTDFEVHIPDHELALVLSIIKEYDNTTVPPVSDEDE